MTVWLKYLKQNVPGALPALALSLLLSVASGCGYLSQFEPTLVPMPTSEANTTPQIGVAVPSTPTLIPSATPIPTPIPSTGMPGVTYTANAQIDLNSHSVIGTLTALYRNQSADQLLQVVFRIVAAETPNAFFLTSFHTDDSKDSYALAGSRLTITLAQPLAPGAAKSITIGFALHVPPMGSTTVATKNGYFGYSGRQFNLGDWLPAVAPYVDGKWLVPQPWPLIGETTVSQAASYDVTIAVSGVPNGQVNKLMVAGPGTVTHPDAATWHFELDHARNFALSVSTDFTVRRAVTTDNITVELYTFGTSGSSAADYTLKVAQDALTRYGQLFDEPCVYKRVVLVEGDFPDGIEFSGLVFVGTVWFSAYTGGAQSWLTLITAHELAHQWWYSSVGDDQSQNPFLDEGFAVFSELLYAEQTMPGGDKWWWEFRVTSLQPQGYVDSSVYDFTNSRLYINAVYLRGALMLQEVRQTIGDAAFLAWLRAYAHTQADRIATPAVLWGLLSPDEYARTASIRAHYLRNPDPINSPLIVTPAATQRGV